MRPHILTTTIAALLAAAFTSPALQAQTTWTNNAGAGDALWSTGANWSAGEPLAGTAAILPTPIPGGGSPITLSTGELANTLTINDAYTLNGGDLTVTTGDITVATGITATVNSTLVGTSNGFTKLGAGTLILGAANTYTGTTEINGGTVQLGITNALATGQTTLIGTGSTAGHLDMSTFSQTLANLNFRSTNAAATNTVTIGLNQTLLVNGTGSLKMGIPSPFANGTTTNATFSGAGTLNVNNANGILDVGTRTVDQNQAENNATLNLTALGAFSADVSELRVGFISKIRGTLLLSNTSNTITANTVVVGNSITDNGPTSGISSITLGTGTNEINTNTLNIGLAKTGGTVAFASQAPGAGTVDIGGKTGAEVDINIGVNTQVDTSATYIATLDLRGHAAAVTADALVLGRWTRNSNSGNATGNVRFDDGTFTVNSINMADKSGNSTAVVTANLEVSGGAFTVNSGGSFTVATRATNGTANGTVSITGGTLTSNVNMLHGGGTASTATLTLDGGTLDMKNFTIGNGTNLFDNLNFRSGTLQNVSEINGGAAITKTAGAGTSTLILAGVNTYTGATNVNEGTVLVTGSIGGSVVTVASAATLGGTGDGVTTGVINGNTTVLNGGNLKPGTSTGLLAFNANLTLGGDTTNTTMEIQGVTRGVAAGYDAVNLGATSQLTYDGVLTLDLTGTIANGTYDLFAFTLAPTGSFDQITLLGSGGYTGNFTNDAGTWTAMSQGATFTFTQATGDLLVIPEPGSALLALLGGTALLLRRRRRGGV